MIQYLSIEQVLAMHDLALREFGGLPGVRDHHLLHSSLEMPKLVFGGQEIYPTVYEKAATYLYHIARNHPFVDGNKRTAYFVARAFLEANGARRLFKKEDLEEVVIDTARGDVSKEELSEFFRTGVRVVSKHESDFNGLLEEGREEELIGVR